MVSLNLNDFLSPSNEQYISTISGTYVSQPSISKTLPSRRLRIDRRHQQQQQNKPLNGNEIEPMPNLMELATSISILPNHSSAMNNSEIPTVDSSNKYSYETQTDLNGVNHHRLYTVTDNVPNPLSKNESAVLRTSVGLGIKMPPVLNGIASHKRIATQKLNNYLSQQFLPTFEHIPRERSMLMSNENMNQPNAMERVNQIIQQLHLPSDKSKRS